MLTQAALLEQLDRCGHPKTPRCLTDWRAKGFLPRLTQRGAGRRRGARYRWTDPDILERALLVDDLLVGGVRGEQVALCVWFAGHNVDLVIVRNAWISRLALTADQMLPKRFYDFEDLLGSLSRKMSQTLAEEIGISARDLSPFILEVLNVFYQRRYRFDIDGDCLDIKTANEIVVRAGKVEPGILVVSDAMLQQWLGFIRDRLSIASCECMLKSVSDDELSDAHRRWKLVLRLGRSLIEASGAEITADQTDELGRRLSIMAGPWCVLALLHLGRSLFASKLEEAERVLASTHNLPPEDAFAALYQIWEGRDQQTLIGA